MKTAYSILLMGALLIVSACGDDGPSGPDVPFQEARVHTVALDFSTADMIVDGPVASAAYDIPSITPGVLENGAVLAFFRAQGTWTALPFTFAFESSELNAVDYTIEFGYAYEHDEQGGFVELFYEASTSEVDPTSLGSQEVKIVVIEGFGAAKTGLDLRDYDAVMDYFNLPK